MYIYVSIHVLAAAALNVNQIWKNFADMWTVGVMCAAKLPDYWTVDWENLGMRLSCSGSEYKMVKEIDKLLAKNTERTARIDLQK